MRRAITLDFGEINTNGDAGLGALDRNQDALPAGAIILKSYVYQGSKPNMGANMILITKTNQKKTICARWYTTSEVLGMDIVGQLKTKHENDGKEGSFSKRLPGFTWIGYDPSGITKGEKAIRKPQGGVDLHACLRVEHVAGDDKRAGARQGFAHIELSDGRAHR